ncbi:Protein of unknown function [Gryllus bimaculatus]|nr:Protein of unknown function [Gryllus bimaculatus]
MPRLFAHRASRLSDSARALGGTAAPTTPHSAPPLPPRRVTATLSRPALSSARRKWVPCPPEAPASAVAGLDCAVPAGHLERAAVPIRWA